MEKYIQFWFDNSPQGVAFLEPVYNKEGTIIDFRYRLVNRAFARIFDQAPDAFPGQIVRTMLPPGAEHDYFESLVSVMQTGESLKRQSNYWQNGQQIWYIATLARVNNQLMVSIDTITDQKKSEYVLQRRLAMESIISTISGRLITLSLDEVDDYLVKALEIISTQIGAERASVFLFDEDYEQGSCVYEWCAPTIESRKNKVRNRSRNCFAWIRERMKKEPVIRLEIDKLPPEATQEKNFMEAIAVHSMIAVPLILGQKTQGFLAFYTINHPQTWDHNDVSLLETFGTLIGNALNRQQQEIAIRRTKQRLEGLREVYQALLSSRLTDRPPLLTALEYVNSRVPCERLTVFRFNKTTNLAVAQCRLVAGRPETTNPFTVSAHFFYEQFLINDSVIYVPDLQVDTAGLAPELGISGQDFRSIVIIPLCSRKECIGAFTLESVNAHFFTPEHLQIAQELAHQLAIILRQQQLDEQLKEYTEQLEQRVNDRTRQIRQLSTLHQAILRHAGQAIISTDINGVIQTANQAAEKLIGYQADELIGRAAYLKKLGTPENPVLFLTYLLIEPLEPAPNLFLNELAKRGYYYCECIILTKYGSRVPVLLAVSALHDEDDTIIGYVGISTDISALKTAEAQLRQKNRELNTFFEGALDMHCISDSQGNISEVNRAFHITLGYSAAELKAIPFLYLIHPDEQKWVYHNLLVNILRKPVRNQINRMRRKDGTYRTIEWNAIGIDNVVYGSARDITERQETEIQLRNLNHRLQLATQVANQGIWEHDYEQNKLYWDDRLWELHGMEPGRTDWNFQEYIRLIHPHDLAAFLTQAQINDQQDTIWNVTRIVRPDGGIRYIETNGINIRDEAGNVIRAIGVVWDVTERKLAEEALRESEQRFREIAENVDEVFWIHSANPFRLLYINPAYERVWNTSFQRLRENQFSFMDTVHKEDQLLVWDFIEQYKAGKQGHIYFRLQVADQPLRWLLARTFMIRDTAGNLIRHIGIISDVTGQKEKERVLQQSLLREQELNQLKSQFVSTASHEFRTPLTTIQSSVDLIKLYLDLPPATAKPPIQKHLDVIAKLISQVSSLLSDMLTISRIEAGKIAINPQQADVVAICEDIIATHFSQQTDQRKARLLLEGQPHTVYVDEKLFSHVMVNLLSNAFKFSKTNPTLHIVFRADTLFLEVIDEGIGIPAKELSALFQAFFRASNTTGIPGTGLGLAISRQFIELMGGHLDIQSQEKVGTICTITLPIGEASQPHEGLSVAPAPQLHT